MKYVLFAFCLFFLTIVFLLLFLWHFNYNRAFDGVMNALDNLEDEADIDIFNLIR